MDKKKFDSIKQQLDRLTIKIYGELKKIKAVK